MAKLSALVSQSLLHRQILVLIFLSCFLISCTKTSASQQLELVGNTMGTTFSIKVLISSDTKNIDSLETSLQTLIEKKLQNINKIMSTYDKNSELSKFNASQSTNWQPVSVQLLSVLQSAKQISILSQGKYDVTIGPLVNLWGFGPEKDGNYSEEKIPKPQDIETALASTGYKQLELDAQQQQIRKHHQKLYIDLSSIAKGYAIDRIADLLESHSYLNYMIEVGGEVRAKGINSQGGPWRIAIEKPKLLQRQVHKIVTLRNMAIATSGDYRNYFEIKGQRYSHIIDPQNGWPVHQDLVSATVLAQNATIADGLATAFLAMGTEKSLKVAEEHKIAVLFVLKNGNSFIDKTSQTFNNYVNNQP